jgi:hypothetical protein
VPCKNSRAGGELFTGPISAAQPRTGRTVLDRRQPLMAIALDVALLGPRTNGRPLEAMILW